MRKHRVSPYFLVMLSFLILMLFGGFLLNLPISQTSGEWGNYVESLYMATSAVCVTGFDCYPNGLVNTITLFGQIVEAILMQIGGLGFLTVLFFFLTSIRKKTTFRDRYFFAQAVNTTDVGHVGRFLKKIILTTFIIEMSGFILGIPAFITIYGNTWEAYWGSAFLALSSFNNAGLDIFGTTSFIRDPASPLFNMPDWAYYYMLTYSMLLIILGGISYLVIFEVFSFKKKPRQWSAYTKICLMMAGILIFFGAASVFLTERVIGGDEDMTVFHAIFLSVSCRTAGFASYWPNHLTTGGRIVTWILMFIGGSPLGTASGIKTTTLFIIILAIHSYIHGKKVHAFNRYYSQSLVVRAMAVMLLSFFLCLAGYLAISEFESDCGAFSGEWAIYETISAFSTTGFTTDLTVAMGPGGKITCVVLMYLGRLGPMTMFSIFSKNMHIEEDNSHLRYVEEDILIG